jgi:hypothetical protein
MGTLRTDIVMQELNGLNIVKSPEKNLGGSISFFNKLNKGSTFSIHHSTTILLRIDMKKILLIEDDTALRETAEY